MDRREQTLLLSARNRSPQEMDVLDLKTGQRATLLRANSPQSLTHAVFSPDDRWIAFLAATPQTRRIYVAKPRGLAEIPLAEWLPVTDGAIQVDNPCFSLDGRLLYFTLDRAGRRSIQAVRFDTHQGRTVGQPFPVLDTDAPAVSLHGVNPAAFDLGIAKDKLVFIRAESKSNIWIADIVPQQ